MTSAPSTDTTARSPRSRRRLIRLAAVVLGITLVLSGCLNAGSRQSQDMVNASRRVRGLPALSSNLSLAVKAQNWAEYLARRGSLAHSNLASGVPYRWRALAENVGYGSSVSSVHGQFMRSSRHRANILGRFNYIGTGVAYGRGRVWVVQVFMLY